MPYGSFIVINTRQVKNDTATQKNPKQKSITLLNLVSPVVLLRSRMMKPTAPREKRKLDARPSIIYCPLTRYYGTRGANEATNDKTSYSLTCMKATGRE